MDIKKIMVVGAGQMGGGIAQVAAQTGITTVLNDIDMAIVTKRKDFITSLLDKNVAKGKITEEQKQSTLSNLILSDKLEDGSDCDLVVEAIVENMDLKAKVFKALDEITPKHAILASNTSSLPITEIAAFTNRPEQVIGMHFMNPVPVMKLVEVIRGIATTDEATQVVYALSQRMGKTPVEVKDFPGFVSNRVLQVMINEAIYCVYENIASIKDIDTVMKLGMNHPMGPLELADFIGLDTVLYILEIMYKGYSDSKYRPCPLLRQYVKAGWLGKKTGKGFYNYK